MKYYAHFGHKDFILCLGYRGRRDQELLPELRRVPSRTTSSSPRAGKRSSCSNSDIHDWKHHVHRHGAQRQHRPAAEGGRAAPGGRRGVPGELQRTVSPTSPLPSYIDDLRATEKTASFLCVRPAPDVPLRVASATEGVVQRIAPLDQVGPADQRRVLRLSPGDLRLHRGRRGSRVEPFQRLIAQEQLFAYQYDGFWMAMDTFKDQAAARRALRAAGDAPWEVWRQDRVMRQEPLACSSSEHGRSRARLFDPLPRRTRDDIEIGCGGTLLKLVRPNPGRRVSTGWCSAPPVTRGGSPQERRRFLTAAEPRRSRSRFLPRSVLPDQWRDDQGLLRGPRERVRAGPRLHPLAATTATRTTAWSPTSPGTPSATT